MTVSEAIKAGYTVRVYPNFYTDIGNIRYALSIDNHVAVEIKTTDGPLYNVTPDEERTSLSHWGLM